MKQTHAVTRNTSHPKGASRQLPSRTAQRSRAVGAGEPWTHQPQGWLPPPGSHPSQPAQSTALLLKTGMGFVLSRGDWLNTALPVVTLHSWRHIAFLKQCHALSALLSRDEEPQMPRKILGWADGNPEAQGSAGMGPRGCTYPLRTRLARSVAL